MLNIFNHDEIDDADNVIEEEIELDDFDDVIFDLNEEGGEAMEDNKVTEYDELINTNICTDYSTLNNVVGHKDQKEELINVVKWFNDVDYLKSKGVSIPKGVLLFGAPGNGKSLLIRELIKCIDAKIYLFKGKSIDMVDSLNNLFKKASDDKKAVIVIDELDLLIARDRRMIRALQENLDGVEQKNDILVFAATNNLNDIPQALLRNGRLEKLIHIPFLDSDEAVELLKKHFKDFNIELPIDFDEEEIGLQLNGIACSGIKAIVNDLVLRNGFTNLNIEMLDNSINNISDKIKDKEKDGNLQVAVHEAGHAVVAHHFSKYFKVNKLNIKGYSGAFTAKEKEEGFWSYNKALAHIKIAMAGNIAEKLMYNNCSLGSESDLQNARNYAYNLINISGYSSCWETLPIVKPNARTETQVKRRKNERKIEKLLKKCEKETFKIVRKNLKTIKILADLLFEKKKLKSSEILSIIG